MFVLRSLKILIAVLMFKRQTEYPDSKLIPSCSQWFLVGAILRHILKVAKIRVSLNTYVILFIVPRSASVNLAISVLP